MQIFEDECDLDISISTKDTNTIFEIIDRTTRRALFLKIVTNTDIDGIKQINKDFNRLCWLISREKHFKKMVSEIAKYEGLVLGDNS